MLAIEKIDLQLGFGTKIVFGRGPVCTTVLVIRMYN